MPEKTTLKRARRAKRQGKAASTQAGEYVRETIHHIRRGKHGARSTKQAIAIGLSKARRSGVKLKAPAKGKAPAATRRKARRELAKARSGHRRAPSPKRSRARLKALRKESRRAASKRALSRQAKRAAHRRSPAERSRAAHKAAHTRSHHRMAA